LSGEQAIKHPPATRFFAYVSSEIL
jgi:hypothetical protein